MLSKVNLSKTNPEMLPQIKSWFQLFGILAIILTLITTALLLVRFFYVFPSTLLLIILFLQLIILLGYIFFYSAPRVFVLAIWLNVIVLSAFSYPSYFYLGYFYLPSLIITLIPAIAAIKKTDQIFWAGIAGSLLGLGLTITRIQILKTNLIFFQIIAFLQVIAIFGYLFRSRLSALLVRLGFFALLVMFIRDILTTDGLLSPFYSLLVAILSGFGTLALPLLKRNTKQIHFHRQC